MLVTTTRKILHNYSGNRIRRNIANSKFLNLKERKAQIFTHPMTDSFFIFILLPYIIIYDMWLDTAFKMSGIFFPGLCPVVTVQLGICWLDTHHGLSHVSDTSLVFKWRGRTITPTKFWTVCTNSQGIIGYPK